MMNIYDIVMLAIALAMDCLTVSVASGMILRRMEWPVVCRMSALFGLFQALMPLAGWFVTSKMSFIIEPYNRWAAAFLLGFIGARMVHEAFLPPEKRTFDPRRLRTQLLLAVATSIDALAIGASMGVTGYSSISQMWVPIVIIGAVSSIFSVVGCHVGASLGHKMIENKPGKGCRWLRPELLGGIILIVIGLKILAGM